MQHSVLLTNNMECYSAMQIENKKVNKKRKKEKDRKETICSKVKGKEQTYEGY